jgi:hypothetical protein
VLAVVLQAELPLQIFVLLLMGILSHIRLLESGAGPVKDLQRLVMIQTVSLKSLQEYEKHDFGILIIEKLQGMRLIQVCQQIGPVALVLYEMIIKYL